MDARDILIRPMVTEHTTDLMAEGKYVFIVDKRANKIQVADDVEEIFKVKVEKVNT
ncbi:MAG: 50S ribosomal protein L23, partial [Selenomonadaceae bacterium]|nr:50S ribosomal protein L23 [Selenomonadaceae bacterium]